MPSFFEDDQLVEIFERKVAAVSLYLLPGVSDDCAPQAWQLATFLVRCSLMIALACSLSLFATFRAQIVFDR